MKENLQCTSKYGHLRISQDICHVRMTDIEGFLTIHGHSDNLLNNKSRYHACGKFGEHKTEKRKSLARKHRCRNIVSSSVSRKTKLAGSRRNVMLLIRIKNSASQANCNACAEQHLSGAAMGRNEYKCFLGG